MSEPGPPPVEPAQIDSRRVAVVGLSISLIASLGLLPFYGWLGDHGHRIWLWTAIASVGVGFFGFLLTLRHKARGRTQ